MVSTPCSLSPTASIIPYSCQYTLFVIYQWRELPQVSFLSRQNTSFVATKLLCVVFVATNASFVAASLLLSLPPMTVISHCLNHPTQQSVLCSLSPMACIIPDSTTSSLLSSPGIFMIKALQFLGNNLRGSGVETERESGEMTQFPAGPQGPWSDQGGTN